MSGSKGKERVRTATLITSLAVAALLLCCGPAPAYETSEVDSIELIEKSGRYDGRKVVYSGEVVGEILRRGEHAWIAVNDDGYGHRHRRIYAELKGGNTGIAVYCRSEMLGDIDFIGSYRASGDIVRVEGIFHRSSRAHGGDLMIEAEKVTVIRRGFEVKEHGFGKEPLVLSGLVLLSVALALLWWKTRS